MKRKLPLWIPLFCLLLIGMVTYSLHLYRARNQNIQTLNTISGSPAVLNGLTVSLDTMLSSFNDKLSTTITLGETLQSTSTYKEGFTNPNTSSPAVGNYYCIDVKSIPTDKPKERTVLYKELSDTVLFTIKNPLDDSVKQYEFPFIHMDTPDDMTLTVNSYNGNGYDDSLVEGFNSSFNYNFFISTPLSVQLNGMDYFTITEFAASRWDDIAHEPCDYEIDNGIFYMSEGTITKVYDYATTSTNNCRILALLSLENKNRLGLIVQEETTIKLLIINPDTKEAEREYDLYKDHHDGSLNTDYISTSNFTHYNASSNTLIITSTYRQSIIPLSEYETLSKQYVDEQDEDKQQLLLEKLSASEKDLNRFVCFTLDDDTIPTKQIDLTNDSSEREEATVFHTRISDFAECTDYIFHNGTLYLLKEDFSILYSTRPLLMAVKEDQIVYEGYLETAANQDYACNRVPISFHTYTFLRYMSNFRLSLTN